MLQKQEHILKLDSPEVIDERNRRLSEMVGRKLGCDDSKTRDLRNIIGVVAQDPSPQKLVEFLHEKLSGVGVNRDDIEKAIARCHEDAIVWLQNTQQHLHDN